MTWSSRLVCWGVWAPLAVFGCGDDGGSGGGDTGSTSAATGDGTDSADGGPVGDVSDDGPPDDCVEGTLACVCLNSQCGNDLECVDDVCVMGPELQVDDPREVIAGLAVPMEMEVDADSFAWTQVSGPTVELLGAEGTQVVVNIPPDATPGDEIVLEASAVRNTIEVTAQTSITVIAPDFQDFLGGIADPTQLGSTEGLAFSGNDQMWVVSTEGFVSSFDTEGAFIQRVDVPGQPVGANFNDENLIIANAGSMAVEQVNSVSGNLSTLFSMADGGGSLGPVNYPLIDDNGNMYFSNRDSGQIFRYDEEDGTLTLWVEGLVNPNALAFGPEGNDVVYVGTAGTVFRIAVEGEDVAGTPAPYLVLGPDTDITTEVDGITFDEAQTMYVGSPNNETLYIARYNSMGETTPIRELTTTTGNSGFVNVGFGRGDFGGARLYWTNLGGGGVGSLRVGVGRL